MNFSIPIERKRERLTKKIEESEGLEFDIESNMRAVTDIKRLDRLESMSAELAIQKLITESFQKQLAELG